MDMYFTLILVILLIGLIIWTLVSWKVNRVATPAYTVLAKARDYEIRRYEAYVVAEVIIEGDLHPAMNAGFRILASYIFGNNTAKSSIDMNGPVTELESGTMKLPMTAPVLARNNSNTSHVVSFIMPARSTIATLPTPTDSRIVLNTVLAHAVAVRKFSWFSNERRVQKQKEALKASLIRDNMIMQSGVSYAGYTAPFTIPFMERHEVMVNIQRY